jgi:DNA-directed RNA polymerase specialized sigma24 family protein
MQTIGQKKGQSPSTQTFQQLLNWLDQGIDSQGRNYLEMRERLVAYFDRKNCPEPDELADETFNRVARRLQEEDCLQSETPAKYCYIVARFVFLEHLRAKQKDDAVLEDLHRYNGGFTTTEHDDDEKDMKERMLTCLEECVAKLDLTMRKVILEYYVGTERVKIENRRALAKSLGISSNALSIRACRIRDRLETCIQQCTALK